MQNITKKHIIKGVYHRLGVTLERWLTPKIWSTRGKNVIFVKKDLKLFQYNAFISMFLCGFPFFFLYFVPLETEKVVLASNN